MSRSQGRYFSAAPKYQARNMHRTIAIFAVTLLAMGLLLGSMMHASAPENPVAVNKMKGDLPTKTPWQPDPDPGIVVNTTEGVEADDVLISAINRNALKENRATAFTEFINDSKMRI